MKKIKEDSSFTSIYTHLWGNVLRVDDAAMAMESRLAECSILLKNHASEIFEWNRIISRTKINMFGFNKKWANVFKFLFQIDSIFIFNGIIWKL